MQTKALLLSTIVLFAIPVQGSMMYTDRATFLAQGSSWTDIDFNAYGSFTDFSTAAGLTTGGVNFVGRLGDGSYYLNVNGVATINGTPALGGAYGTYAGSNTLTGTTTVTLPANINAIGFSYAGPNFTDLPILWQVTLSDGSTFSGSEPVRHQVEFAGFSSSTPISSLSFATFGSVGQLKALQFDDFVFGNAGNAVPEPSTGMLLFLGIVLIGVAFRNTRTSRGASPLVAPLAY